MVMGAEEDQLPVWQVVGVLRHPLTPPPRLRAARRWAAKIGVVGDLPLSLLHSDREWNARSPVHDGEAVNLVPVTQAPPSGQSTLSTGCLDSRRR